MCFSEIFKSIKWHTYKNALNALNAPTVPTHGEFAILVLLCDDNKTKNSFAAIKIFDRITSYYIAFKPQIFFDCFVCCCPSFFSSTLSHFAHQHLIYDYYWHSVVCCFLFLFISCLFFDSLETERTCHMCLNHQITNILCTNRGFSFFFLVLFVIFSPFRFVINCRIYGSFGPQHNVPDADLCFGVQCSVTRQMIQIRLFHFIE